MCSRTVKESELLKVGCERLFQPCKSVSAGSCSKYRSGSSDSKETRPLFHWFKSTYVISSLHQEKKLPSGLDPALISFCYYCLTKSTLCFFLSLKSQICRWKARVGATCFHLDDKCKKNTAGCNLQVPASILSF